MAFLLLAVSLLVFSTLSEARFLNDLKRRVYNNLENSDFYDDLDRQYRELKRENSVDCSFPKCPMAVDCSFPKCPMGEGTIETQLCAENEFTVMTISNDCFFHYLKQCVMPQPERFIVLHRGPCSTADSSQLQKK